MLLWYQPYICRMLPCDRLKGGEDVVECMDQLLSTE